MRALLVIFLTSVSFFLLAQRQYVNGLVVDQETGEVVIGSHIKNLVTGHATTTNQNGKFSIPAQVGDTLLFSNVGYQRLGWVAKASWFEGERVSFQMRADTIMLQEVVIGKLPEYNHFKQLIIKTQPQDTALEVFGMAAIDVMKIPMKGSPLVTEEDLQKGPSVGFTFNMDGLTKKGKERKKLQKILDQRGTIQKAQHKFNREWVAKETKLEGDQLTSFIAYCNFTPEFLAETTLYVIHEKMMAKLNDFLAEFSEG